MSVISRAELNVVKLLCSCIWSLLPAKAGVVRKMSELKVESRRVCAAVRRGTFAGNIRESPAILAGHSKYLRLTNNWILAEIYFNATPFSLGEKARKWRLVMFNQ
jgi:hypothetical protein